MPCTEAMEGEPPLRRLLALAEGAQGWGAFPPVKFR